MMPSQECKTCKYCKKSSFRQVFTCGHKEVYACAERYEEETNKKIKKEKNFIGFKEPKTCLRWCPLKYLESDIKAINKGE